MACGARNGLRNDMFSFLKPFKIIVFPDLRKDQVPFKEWTKFTKKLKQRGFNIYVSDLLIRKATKKQVIDKLDIADYFI